MPIRFIVTCPILVRLYFISTGSASLAARKRNWIVIILSSIIIPLKITGLVYNSSHRRWVQNKTKATRTKKI